MAAEDSKPGPAKRKRPGAKKQPKRVSHARTRARTPTDPRKVNPKSKAERVDFVAGMMERLEWERGRSAPRLAEIWGLSVAAVEADSSEAHRRITADANEARRDISAGCRKLFKQAVKKGRAKDAKAVGELWAVVSGAKAPEEHIVTTNEASPAEAARLVREAFGEKALPKAGAVNGPAEPSGAPAVPPVTEE